MAEKRKIGMWDKEQWEAGETAMRHHA